MTEPREPTYQLGIGATDMTDNTQPDALDFADWLESVGGGGVSANHCAALLREQHARIAELEAKLEAIGAGGVSGPLMGCASLAASAGSEPVAWAVFAENANLRAGYAAARLEIESLQARIKTMAEEHADELMVAHLDGRMRAEQPAGARTPWDYAIEHAEYMAKKAERLLDAINHLNSQRDEDGEAFDSDALTHAEEAVTEAFGAVRNGIYEFRKRRDLASAQPAGAQQPGAAYAALPECSAFLLCKGSDVTARAWNVDQMRAFADATHAIRASHGQASAQAAPQQGGVCDKAPAGWLCTRQHGHEGPCAAEPTLSARPDEWVEGYAAGVRDGWKDALRTQQAAPTPQADSQPALDLDMAVMQLAESVGLIGPASRTHDLHAAVQRFHDLICANATIKAAAMAAEVISGAPADSALEDAARYRFLAAHCRSTSEHWGGRWSIIVDGPAPKSHDSEDDFDEAVDAARAAQKGGS